MINNLLPPGFKDETFEQSSIEHKYKNIILDVFQKNGYRLVQTPLIEYCNENNQNNAFVINVKKEKKDYVIRNDMTMQIVRLASARLKNYDRPLKLCYYGDVVRKKGTLLRPERQFLQIGAECIGEQSYLADVEMLNLAYQSLTAVGIKDISIELSSQVFLEYLLKHNNETKIKKLITSFLRKKDKKNTIKHLDKDSHDFGLNLLSCHGILKEKKLYLEKLKINKETSAAVDEILLIYKTFLKIHPKVNFVIDLTESNYLEYHTGTRFTIFAKNVRGEVARGGRYISKNGQKQENSTGFNCYMDSIMRASTIEPKNKRILIPFSTNDKLIKNLLNKGYFVDRFFGKEENIKKSAIKNGFNAYLIKNKIIQLKLN